MNARVAYIAIAVTLLHSCKRAGESQSGAGGSSDTVPAIAIAPQYTAFEREADSTLCGLDSTLTIIDLQTGDPGRRRHMAQRRRHFIKAQYRLDKLREKLEGHSNAYRTAIKNLDRIEHENPGFIRDYGVALRALDSTVAVLRNDTLP